MLNPPIRNIGVKGIYAAAERIPCWSREMNTDEIRWALFNTHIFISPVGGSGGGIFRYMFSRFLQEAVAITGEARLAESAARFKRICDAWESFAAWAKDVSETSDPAARLGESTAQLGWTLDIIRNKV